MRERSLSGLCQTVVVRGRSDTVWSVSNSGGEGEITVWSVSNSGGEGEITVWSVSNSGGEGEIRHQQRDREHKRMTKSTSFSAVENMSCVNVIVIWCLSWLL